MNQSVISVAGQVSFWIFTGLIAYTYVFYPVIIWTCARFLRNASAGTTLPFSGISIVMVAHQEGERILCKIQELIQQLDASDLGGEVIVVLDGVGANPNTDAVLGPLDDRRIQVVRLAKNYGKAVALNHGVQRAAHDVLVFSDVRQTWDPSALSRLLSGFSDPTVGAVSGELVLKSSEGETAGVGLYWRYEKWLRKLESQYFSVTGVTGAICAVRRNLFANIPAGTLLDDVYWPLKVVMQGFRVKHEPSAMAFDRLPISARDELRRKIRTLSGNFQLICRLPSALMPWKNCCWWQFISHKLLRLIIPWALLGIFISTFLITHPAFRTLFYAQALAYSLIIVGIWTGVAFRHRMSSAAAAFLLLNYAAWLAFWIWLFGRETNSWTTIDYDPTNCLKDV